MEHLAETQFNEYLDGILDASSQASLEAHLSGCADCQERLASMQAVFQALATLPEETMKQDLTSSVLQALPRGFSGMGWRLAFAIQAGVSLGLLLLLMPFMIERIVGRISGFIGRFAMPDVKFPNPINLHVSPPVIYLPHPPILTLPISITQANLPVWLILGIAALALFAVGNFSLVLHSSSKP